MSKSFAPVSPAYANSFVVAVDPLIAYMDGVVSPQECEHIIDVALGHMQRAVVSSRDKSKISESLSGSHAWLKHDEDEVIGRVASRIAEIIGISLDNAESLNVVHYATEQQYEAHYDAFDLTTETGQRCCKQGGQRLVTALVYLNDVFDGGVTAFPNKGVEVIATKGRMAIFHNTLLGSVMKHPDSLHAGTPVLAGEKWAFNLWFRARPMAEIQDFSSAMYPDMANLNHPSPASPQMTRRRLTLKVNRAKKNFEEAFLRVCDALDSGGSPRCFTYWETYFGTEPDIADVPADAVIHKMIDRKILNSLSNKRSLAIKIAECELGHIAPATFWTVEDARAFPKPVDVWFIKNIYASGGKNMQCIDGTQLHSFELKPNHIIQAGVSDIALYEGRKFTTRVYVLVWHGALYLYNNGFIVVHGVPYVEGSTDYAVQIDHAGYMQEDKPVTMCPLDELPGYQEYWQQIRKVLRDARPVLQPCADASSVSDYVILGIDLIFQNSGAVQIIEINTSPNFIHVKEVNTRVNVPMLEASMRMMAGLETPAYEAL